MKFKILPKILPAFVAVGMGCLLLKGVLTQDTTYHQYVVEPTDNIQSQVMFFDEKIQKRKAEKEKYKAWTNENINLITDLKIKDPEIKEKVDNLPIIIKDSNSLWDKVSLFLQESLYKIDENYVNEHSMIIAEGRATQLMRDIDIETNEASGKRIYIGLQAINNANSTFFNDLRHAFKNNEQQMYDYILLHELSHFIAFEVKGNEGKDQQELFDEIIAKFEKVQGTKKFKHNDKDKELILEQYGESVADVLAIQLLYKKYPELKKDDQLPHDLAKVRTKNHKDVGHMNMVALESFQEMKKENLPETLEGMLSLARHKALENTQFYSTRPFAEYEKKIPEERFIEVEFVNKFDTIKAIQSTRKLYVEVLEDLQEQKNKKKM